MLAGVGRFCWERRRLVLVSWLALFIVGMVVGSQVFTRLRESNGSSSAESVRGFNLLDKASPHGMPMVAVVDGLPVATPTTESAVRAAAERIRGVDGVLSVVTAYDSPDSRLRAADGSASLILITTRRSDDMVEMHRLVDDVRSAVEHSVPGATVKVGGDLAVMRDEMVTSQTDLVRGELIALPILLLALFIVFRGLRAALLPLAGALVTVAGALLLLLAATGVVDVAGYAVDVVALFGLALAVDYSLLMVSRFREERAAGLALDSAVVASVASAGRTITFSAMTVIASLAGLFAFGDPTFFSLAVGGIATTGVALLAGLTLIPALLAAWGRRIGAESTRSSEEGAFGRLARRVQARPLVYAGASVAVLVAAGLPFLSVSYGNGDPRLLPRGFESRQVADALTEHFPTMQADPVKVVVQRPEDDSALVSYVSTLRARADIQAVEVESIADGLSVIDVTPTGSTQGDQARRLVTQLRADRPEFPIFVTGSAAFLVDFKSHIADRLPWALALICLATFALLFLMTGSLLVPLKALVMNTLSLGASFGALVWIFQEGHLSGLLGFDAFGAIEVWVPVVVFVFAFGLSMDYEVFLLARIKECYDECGDSDQAVVNGLQRSGRIITSAAVLVTIVFLGFALGQNLGIKQMGAALAIAVIVDATIVRCLLVPATMTLLGDANWWAPAPLRRLHERIGLREAPRQITLPDAAEPAIPAPRSQEERARAPR